jgi:hypothetical protein
VLRASFPRCSARQALRGQGDLARARSLFDQAARLAEAQGDAHALGEAALGAGGLWLDEQPSPVAQALVSGWRRAALAEVDPASQLAVRLRVREAAERDYESGGTKAVLAALPEARRCGDRAALAEALHLAQSCLLGPKFTKLRSTLGDELLAVAAAADDPFEACRGLMWRATNLLLTGHPHADRALTLLRAALAEHRHLAMSYVVSAVDVMLAIRTGALERAERLAGESASLGRQAGDPDVLGWYGAHLVTIRFFQGRGEELLPMLQELVASPELREQNDAFLGALATAASMAGDSWTATSALRRLCHPNLAALRHNSIWLVTVFGAVLAAQLLGDRDVAAEAYELLVPFAGLPVTGSLAITCMGSAHYRSPSPPRPWNGGTWRWTTSGSPWRPTKRSGTGRPTCCPRRALVKRWRSPVRPQSQHAASTVPRPQRRPSAWTPGVPGGANPLRPHSRTKRPSVCGMERCGC